VAIALWWRGVVVGVLASINIVCRHLAQLVLGWVGKQSWYVTKSPRSTQPSIPAGHVNRVPVCLSSWG